LTVGIVRRAAALHPVGSIIPRVTPPSRTAGRDSPSSSTRLWTCSPRDLVSLINPPCRVLEQKVQNVLADRTALDG